MRFLFVLLLVLAAVPAIAATAADLEVKVAGTDMASADAIFELAKWCEENKFPTKARQYLNQAIRVDPEHEASRAALGQVKIGERWIARSQLSPERAAAADKTGAANLDGPVEAARVAAGPGPSAAQVEWNLTLPVDPEPQALFVNSYLDKMAKAGNDSRDMDVAISTLMTDDNFKYGLPRLCAALLRNDFNDLFGGTSIALELLRKGRTAEARTLLPFLVKGSEHVTDAGDLEFFAAGVGSFKDKRCVPRLIELLGHSSRDVQLAAQIGVSAITLLPEKAVTAEKTKAWWDLNHNVSDQQVYREQLGSADPKVALGAAEALYESRDRAIMVVAIRLLLVPDREVNGRAIDLIQKITGLTWNYDTNLAPAAKKKVADRLADWWKGEQFKFIWVEDAKAITSKPQVQRDIYEESVAALGSIEGNKAQVAESDLATKGKPAVPALLKGLENANVIIRRKCNEILKLISKQDVAFDARGSDEERKKGANAWTAWARKEKLIADAAGDEEPAAVAPAPQGPPPKAPAPKAPILK